MSLVNYESYFMFNNLRRNALLIEWQIQSSRNQLQTLLIGSGTGSESERKREKHVGES